VEDLEDEDPDVMPAVAAPEVVADREDEDPDVMPAVAASEDEDPDELPAVAASPPPFPPLPPFGPPCNRAPYVGAVGAVEA